MGQELLLDSVQGRISPKWGFHVMTSLSPDHHGLESITKGCLIVLLPLTRCILPLDLSMLRSNGPRSPPLPSRVRIAPPDQAA